MSLRPALVTSCRACDGGSCRDRLFRLPREKGCRYGQPVRSGAMLSIIDCLLVLGVTMEPDAKPVIVLIHGAFADASGWSEVIQRLSALGYRAYAPANPLRGVISDGDYLRTFLSTIEGPVVLVGHSYVGSVITSASGGARIARPLVYIAA